MSKKKRIPKEYLGAFKEGHRFAWREFIDDDFSHDLLRRASHGDEKAKEALEFYTRFNNEFYKCVFIKDNKSDLIEGEAAWRERYNNKNGCERDVFSKFKVVPVGSADVSLDDEWVSEAALSGAVDIKKEMEKAKKQ